jgi:hypothetical protein
MTLPAEVSGLRRVPLSARPLLPLMYRSREGGYGRDKPVGSLNGGLPAPVAVTINRQIDGSAGGPRQWLPRGRCSTNLFPTASGVES